MLVSLTIIRYKKLLVPFAMLAMAIHRLPMAFRRGCSFWKLLGSGKNGTFDLSPDWQQWGLLAVWHERQNFDKFYNHSLISKWWNLLAEEKWTIICEPLQSHGKWDGKQPFGDVAVTDYTGPVAVLTRATIRISKLKRFWSNVDDVAGIMKAAHGYVTSFGVGEAFAYRSATFSIWESIDDMKAFAYGGSREHAEVIKKTRSEEWYREELFTRFKPIAAFGTLHGTDPLKGMLSFVAE